MEYNKLNIGFIKAELRRKELKEGFNDPKSVTDFYNYAKVVQVWQPETDREKELHEYRVYNNMESPMLVKVGDVIKVPPSAVKEKIIDDITGDTWELVHMKDITAWYSEA